MRDGVTVFIRRIDVQVFPSTQRRSRLVKQVLLGTLVVVWVWGVYGLFQRWTKATVREKPAVKVVEVKVAGPDEVEHPADDGGAAFGMVPLVQVDPPTARTGNRGGGGGRRGDQVDQLLEKAEQMKDAGRILERGRGSARPGPGPDGGGPARRDGAGAGWRR